MIFHCCDELRRNATAAHSTLNGIDFLEVWDREAPPVSPRQRTLFVRLLKPVPGGLAKEQVRIDGGERERRIRIEWVGIAAGPLPEATQAERDVWAQMPHADRTLVVRTDRYGDFSPYRLRLTDSATGQALPEGFDPRLVEVEFSFKVECESDFDCRKQCVCPETPADAPAIDYLAKDYASFRRLVLDRITHLVPGWRERSAADVGVTLAELLAYVGDHLSYRQDAVATEAYLETARLRTSLRRHALLVDYHVHDGCNARAWLHVPVAAETVNLPAAETRFHSRVPGLPARFAPGSRDDEIALRSGATIFEPLHGAVLHSEHNEIAFYTWGDRRCCLPQGATAATLVDHLEHLVAGDVLLFEEVKGPLTGEPTDADPNRRHVVRLTKVRRFASDPADAPLADPLNGALITEIEWSHDDRLPFPLCISSVTDEEHGEEYVDGVSVARGNIVLADHGWTLPDAEALPEVGGARLRYPPDREDCHCAASEPVLVPARYRPRLAEGPLTFQGMIVRTTEAGGVRKSERVAFDPSAPAAKAMEWRVEEALPDLLLSGEFEDVTASWEARRDLLGSEADHGHFVVEVEHDGSAALRFGDDVHGRRPRPGTRFSVGYRVGNGRAGNVGADAIAHVVTGDLDVLGVRNPLPASGGTDQESADVVRRRAPQAFRRQERAVTPEDYAEKTELHPGVQRAAATLRWTGSWHTVFVTVDRTGGERMDAAFEKDLSRHIDRYRMAGHDTEFDDPTFVSLEIDLLVCVRPGYLRSHVRAGLLDELSNRVLPDGRRGLFHADNLTFDQTVYLSPLYAAARRVAGVASVEVTRFHRQGDADPQPLADGYLELSRLEVARLDNDPNFPEHGVLRLTLVGGR